MEKLRKLSQNYHQILFLKKSSGILVFRFDHLDCLPYTDTFMYSTECFKDQQSSILNKVIKTGHQEEIIDQYLKKTNKKHWSFKRQTHKCPIYSEYSDNLTTLLANSADDKLMISSLIFHENRIWHFMQNVSSGDILHEISKPVFWDK